MDDQNLERKVRHLEARVKHLESFIMESLIFRLDELNDVVKTIDAREDPPNETYSYLRHTIDKARVYEWKDRGEWG